METAGLLGLAGARWRPEVMLRERDWGEYDLRSQLQRREAFEDYEARRRRESLFWAPPGRRLPARRDRGAVCERRTFSASQPGWRRLRRWAPPG